jgi:hypothetical protein
MEFLRDVGKHVALALFRVGLLPRKYRVRTQRFAMFRQYRLKWNDRGFWLMDPMPTEAVLAAYYGSVYWDERGAGARNTLLNPRDLDHFLMLKPRLEKMLAEKGSFRALNFGAGHGGISHLLHTMGAEVWNAEQGGLRNALTGERWTTVDTIDQAEGKFDLVYGSHSLEHVQDIDTFLGALDSKLAPGGLIFFEVPNCRRSNCAVNINGGDNNKTLPPHTYYFTLDFFRGLPYQPLLLATFNHGEYEDSRYVIQPQEDGQVIRYMAQVV